LSLSEETAHLIAISTIDLAPTRCSPRPTAVPSLRGQLSSRLAPGGGCNQAKWPVYANGRSQAFITVALKAASQRGVAQMIYGIRNDDLVITLSCGDKVESGADLG
jgi:hypothetical protein